MAEPSAFVERDARASGVVPASVHTGRDTRRKSARIVRRCARSTTPQDGRAAFSLTLSACVTLRRHPLPRHSRAGPKVRDPAIQKPPSGGVSLHKNSGGKHNAHRRGLRAAQTHPSCHSGGSRNPRASRRIRAPKKKFKRRHEACLTHTTRARRYLAARTPWVTYIQKSGQSATAKACEMPMPVLQ